MIGKISLQVILAVAVASSTIFGLSSYLILQAQSRSLIAQVEHQAQLVSETIKSSTKYAMLLNRREDVHRIIDTIGEQEEIDQVRIFNKEGRIIYSPDKALLGEHVDTRAEACFACHAADQPLNRLTRPERTRIFRAASGERHLGIINPIYNEPGCWQASCHAHASSQSVLGILDVTQSLAEVDRQLGANARAAAALTVAAILAISAIIWLFFNWRVSGPVGKLLEATAVVATGDLSHELPQSRNDELGQLMGSFNEMTRRLASAKSQIYRSNRLASLGRLAAGVAHEINNPLTGVLVHSSFLHKRAPEGSEEREDLEVIVRETKRCREIVRGLLDFARQAPLSTGPADCNELVQRALRIVDNQLAVNNVRVETDLGEDLPKINVDGNQMVQVLVNLIVNAADAVEDGGGALRLSTAHDPAAGDPAVVIAVADDGCGIPTENLDKIFEPFFTTKDQGGTGLGLSVVWGIIQEHGGKVDVATEVGVGSTFTIRLPVGAPAAIVGERPEGGARD